jgi:Zn-dependent M28 family amino/carboxypeptidase
LSHPVFLMPTYYQRLCCLLFFLSIWLQAFTQSHPLLDSLITEKNLKKVVYYLSADSLQGRLANTRQADTAAAFIARKMDTAGLKKIAGLNGYYDQWGKDFRYAKNVIGFLPGTTQKEEIVIISAHYDHLGTSSTWKPDMKRDVVYNGANDNASGVAVMLSLASYFAQYPLGRSVMFIAFGSEELGLWGSKGFASLVNAKSIMAQINLEMLGRKGRYKRPLITGHTYSNLRDVLNVTLYDLLQVANYFEEDDGRGDLFRRSDNFPLAQLGIPAHSIMLTTDEDPYYHRLGDEAKTLDYATMCDIARKIAVAITPLVNGFVTPNRINVDHLP